MLSNVDSEIRRDNTKTIVFSLLLSDSNFVGRFKYNRRMMLC